MMGPSDGRFNSPSTRAVPQFAALFRIIARCVVAYPQDFTFRRVRITNPCVFDKPLMPRPAVWTVGAAEKYRGAPE
jgi:hypothetical protein